MNRYTCPKCGAKHSFEQYEDSGDGLCRCSKCGHIASAYTAPLDEWPTVTFGKIK